MVDTVEIVIRFIVGGLVVSAFSVLGDILRPRTFGGIFGAAPSVALATLGLTLLTHGPSYASLESRSMILGAVALLVYSVLVSRVLQRSSNTLLVAGSALLAWLAVAFGAWAVLLR
jgi:hypothetical protein